MRETSHYVQRIRSTDASLLASSYLAVLGKSYARVRPLMLSDVSIFFVMFMLYIYIKYTCFLAHFYII